MVADAPLAVEFKAGAFGFGMLVTAWGGGTVIGSLFARRMGEGREGVWLVNAGIVIASGPAGADAARNLSGSINVARNPWERS